MEASALAWAWECCKTGWRHGQVEKIVKGNPEFRQHTKAYIIGEFIGQNIGWFSGDRQSKLLKISIYFLIVSLCICLLILFACRNILEIS